MSIELILKVIHVIAAIVAVGANLTYAFWLRRAGTDDRERLVWTIGSIRRLDDLIATPAYVVVLLTGLGMVFTGAFSFLTGWIQVALGLYVLVVILSIALYAPALRRQLAEAEADPTSAAYRAAAARSNVLGILVTVIVLVIVFLMVTKPLKESLF
jgi:uncharacterized membrane protein